MLAFVLALILILWLLGYINIPNFSISDITLFTFLGHPITLFNLLTFGLVLWLISILPQPFQIIASIIFILWILSILGIIAITGFSNIIVLLVIVGIIAFLFGRS